MTPRRDATASVEVTPDTTVIVVEITDETVDVPELAKRITEVLSSAGAAGGVYVKQLSSDAEKVQEDRAAARAEALNPPTAEEQAAAAATETPAEIPPEEEVPKETPDEE